MEGTRPQSASRGFTLLELLVVLVVLALLASLVAPNVLRHVGSAKSSTARAQIELLGAALDGYRLDVGRYPTSEQGLAALWESPNIDPRPGNWRGPYLRKALPLDPWGHAYVYNLATDGRVGFDLKSLGADGKVDGVGEDADISLGQR